MRRLAVMPLTAPSQDAQAETGAATLQPVLIAELGKTKAFEIVSVSPEQLQQWTGRASWTAEEKLPPDLLKRLQETLSCDAVLFCRLTQYRPYRPVAIGWRLKLVAAKDADILWSVDEVFDGGEPAVVNAARRYAQEHFQQPPPLADSSSILNSPRRFGQYTLSAVLATLPGR
jgi:hypothetical protein